MGLGVGIQAMTMTMVQYLPGMILAFFILRGGALDGVQWHASGKLDAVLGRLWGPFVDAAEAHLPGWALFVVGIATILLSFNLIDRVLPQIDSNSTVSKRRAWLTRPWTMFLLGCIVATLTLSVSVALTVLVPLAVKGYVKRDEALPTSWGRTSRRSPTPSWSRCSRRRRSPRRSCWPRRSASRSCPSRSSRSSTGP